MTRAAGSGFGGPAACRGSRNRLARPARISTPAASRAERANRSNHVVARAMRLAIEHSVAAAVAIGGVVLLAGASYFALLIRAVLAGYPIGGPWHSRSWWPWLFSRA